MNRPLEMAETEPGLEHAAAGAPDEIGRPSHPAEPGAAPIRRDWRNPTTEAAVLLVLVVVAVRIGLSPLHDNSFLTHLATGRIILDTGAVPHHDPYSWSAYGHAWTVQSWGASLIYATAERVVGLVGIRIIDTVCTVSLVLILWRLTKAVDGLVGRLLIGVLVVAMGTGLWVERPLLFGAVFLGLTLLAAEDELDPRWLVPVMWVWVNVHGSFPFGLAILVLLGFGRWLDERKRPVVELRALGWATLGTLLGGIGPVGPKILLFPLELLGKREAFSQVQEWQPMSWSFGVDTFFGAQLVIVALIIVFRDRRWRSFIPAVIFGAAAVTSSRNILQASIVLTPIMAHGLRGLGSIDGRKRPSIARPITMALSLVIVFSAVVGLQGPDTALDPYPEKAAAFMRSEGLLDTKTRVMTRDFVGNYLEYRYGPDQVRVFIDDRVDMYPMPVIRQYFHFLSGGSRYQETLDQIRATAVLWDRKSGFARWIERSDRWKVVYRDQKWVVAVPQTPVTPSAPG